MEGRGARRLEQVSVPKDDRCGVLKAFARRHRKYFIVDLRTSCVARGVFAGVRQVCCRSAGAHGHGGRRERGGEVAWQTCVDVPSCLETSECSPRAEPYLLGLGLGLGLGFEPIPVMRGGRGGGVRSGKASGTPAYLCRGVR